MLYNLIDKFLFAYILSIFFFTYKPGLSIITNIIAACFIYLIVLKTFIFKKKVYINRLIILMFLFIMMCTISYFVAVDGTLVLMKLKTLFLNFIFLLALINYIDDYDKFNKILIYYVYSGALASVYVLLNSDLSIQNRLGGVLGNENEIGMIIAIAFVYSLYFVIYERNYKLLLCSIVMIPTVLLTGSRKGSLMVVIPLLIMTFISNENMWKKKLKLIALILFIFAILYYLSFKIPAFYAVLGRRYEHLFDFLINKTTNEDSILTRDMMIKYGYEMFFKRPLFGFGIDNYQVLFNHYCGVMMYSHNNYIELLVGTGMAGTIAFYSMYVDTLIRLKKRFTYRDNFVRLLFALNASIMVLGYALVHYDSKHFFIILAMSSMIPSIIDKKDMNDKQE